MKYYFLLLILLSTCSLRAQNMVSDPGFEMDRDTNVCFGGIDTSVTNQTSVFFRMPKMLVHWHSPSYALSGYINQECRRNHPGSVTGDPAFEWGAKNPYEGDAYAQIFCYGGFVGFRGDTVINNARSYLQTRLSIPLKKDAYYKVNFYVSPTYNVKPSDNRYYYATANLGAYLSANRPTRFNNPLMDTNTVIRVTPQVQNHPDSILSDTSRWYRVCGTFKAQGGEKWLTLGNFATDSLSNLQLLHSASVTGIVSFASYYFIDQVSVKEVNIINPGRFAKDTIVCAGSSFSFNLNAPPGAAFYQWSTGDSTASITVDSVGTYWLNAEYGCGLETDTFRIIEQEPLRLDLGSDIAFCENVDSVKITAPVGFNQYKWSTGDSLNEIWLKQTGNYTLMAAYLCDTLYDTIHVLVKDKPLPPVVSDTGYCLNAVVQLQAKGQNLLWYDSLKDASPSPDAPTYFNSQLGSRSFFVSQSIAECESDLAGFQVQTELPTQLDLGNDTLLCGATSLNIGKSTEPGWNYLWNTGDSTSNITISNSGIYQLQASNYCNTTYDSIHVDFNIIPPSPNVENLTFCNTEFLNADSLKVQGQNLRWYASESSIDTIPKPVFSHPLSKEQYNFYVSQLIDGCESKRIDFKMEVIPKPELNIISDTVLCEGEQFLIDAFVPNATYVWNTGATTSSLFVQSSGVYGVEVRHKCGTVKAQTEVNFEVCETKIFVPNAFSPNGDGRNDIFFPKGENFTILKFQLFNRWGKLIYDHPSPWNGVYQGQVVKSGTFVYSVEYEDFKGNSKHLKGSFTVLK